jgi:1-acyl-sn-glycerol-3-phosphate acyltransferase
LVQKSGAPVLPVAVINTDKALPRNAIMLHPAKIRVYIGKPFHPSTEGEPKEVRKRIAREVMEKIRELLEMGKSVNRG